MTWKRGAESLAEHRGMRGTQPRGQVLEVSLTSRPEFTGASWPPLPSPLSPPTCIACFLSAEAFNHRPHDQLSSWLGKGLLGSIFTAGKCPAKMLPLFQAEGQGDAFSVAEAGDSQVKLLCSGSFLLGYTPLSPTPDKPWGLDPLLRGFPFAFLDRRQAKRAFSGS